ncbi:alpha/beta hydrolase, partial [Rhodococcoides yunnanense]|uniref:alpha/beta hydrolase n=1 Tax=Rhodococcoides yunnanense TaxID=278209 RepID=UPI0022B20518
LILPLRQGISCLRPALGRYRIGATRLNTVIGHSYGSTVIGHAMSDGNSLAVDNVVFAGSPGVGYGVNGVGELSLDNVDPTSNNERIFATAASSDPVTWIGDGVDGIRVAASVFGLPAGELGHGADPTNPSFGATVFDSHPGPSVNIVGVDIGFSPSTHSNYFVEESQSLRGMAQIVAGTR